MFRRTWENYWSEGARGDDSPDPGGDAAMTDFMQSQEDAYQAVAKLQEEANDHPLLMADAQRNLEQARRAVAASRRDTGWTQNASFRPPRNHSSGKGTSTWMEKGKSKFMPSNMFVAKGEKGSRAYGKYNPGYGKDKYTPWFVDYAPYQLMTMDVRDNFDSAFHRHAPGAAPDGDAVTQEPQINAAESVMDIGATVSAGCEAAVSSLLTSLASGLA